MKLVRKKVTQENFGKNFGTKQKKRLHTLGRRNVSIRERNEIVTGSNSELIRRYKNNVNLKKTYSNSIFFSLFAGSTKHFLQCGSANFLSKFKHRFMISRLTACARLSVNSLWYCMRRSCRNFRNGIIRGRKIAISQSIRVRWMNRMNPGCMTIGFIQRPMRAGQHAVPWSQ